MINGEILIIELDTHSVLPIAVVIIIAKVTVAVSGPENSVAVPVIHIKSISHEDTVVPKGLKEESVAPKPKNVAAAGAELGIIHDKTHT